MTTRPRKRPSALAQKRGARPRSAPAMIDLGIAGRRAPIHSHIACFWETEEDLAEALGFLETGLRGSDHCVVIGDKGDIERILPILESRGLQVEDLKAQKRLTVLERTPTAQGMLDGVSEVLEKVLAAGASIVRLSGIVGWGRRAGPADAELFSYEARLTKMAQKLPCVILCLHEVNSLTGLIARYGVISVHPRVLAECGAVSNPLTVPLEEFPERLDAVAAEMSKQQGARAQLHQEAEILQRLDVVREEERARIAREVHDEVGQALTALQMDVDWLNRKLFSLPPKELSPKLQSMSELLDRTLGSVQRITTELRPGVLDELGLTAAIDWYVQDFEKRTGIACRLRSDLKEIPLDGARAMAVFRILQEALTNVARHAEATRVDIRLSAEGDRLFFEVRDNGRGIPDDRVKDIRSLGLLGMRERARSLGGDVSIRGAPGRGTSIVVTIPR